jgi:uncharacterized protein involved in exopolysaccharide biosynthesis
MDEKQYQGGALRTSGTRDEVKIVDLLIVLAKHKRLIVGMPLIAAVAAAAISLVLPPVYSASATLLPPQGQSSASALLSQLGGAASLISGAAGIKGPNDVYVGMLKSRTLGDKLIKRFSLLKVYETPSPEKARKRLVDSTIVTAAKSGLITIEVEDRDRERAAQLTNAYVEELMNLTKVLAVTEASQRRLFFERQLEQAKNHLATAELELKRALDTHGVVSVDAETQAIVATLAQLRARISAKEIQLNSMKAFMTPNNIEYKRGEEELHSLQAQLGQLENGRGGEGARNPQGLENIKVLRDVKYNQMLYELLAKQYEVARLDEASDSSVVQVLDSAVVPEQRARPKRAVMVLLTAAISFVASVVLAFAMEGWARLRQRADFSDGWGRLATHLRPRKTKTGANQQ